MQSSMGDTGLQSGGSPDSGNACKECIGQPAGSVCPVRTRECPSGAHRTRRLFTFICRALPVGSGSLF